MTPHTKLLIRAKLEILLNYMPNGACFTIILLLYSCKYVRLSYLLRFPTYFQLRLESPLDFLQNRTEQNSL